MATLREIGIFGAIDCHSHAGGVDLYNMITGSLPMAQSVDDLVLKARNSGISRVVTFPFPTTGYYDIKSMVRHNQRTTSGHQDFPYQVENRALLIGCQNTDFPVLPFVSIDPSAKVQEQLDYIQKECDQQSIYGLKLHTMAAGSSALDLSKTGFVDFARSHSLPILIHSALGDKYSHPENILLLAKKFPDLRICIAHLAGLDEDVIKEAASMDNLFIDTCPFLQICERVKSGSNLVHRPNLVDPDHPADSLYRYYLLLKNNMIWGTDEPWTKVVNPARNTSCIHNYQEEVDVLSQLFQVSDRAVVDITTTNTIRFLFG